MMCQYSKNSTSHYSAVTGESFEIKSSIHCTDKFVIYSIQCKKCPKIQYVGQTSNTICTRFSNHRSDIITKKLYKPVGQHFNLPGHSFSDLIFSPFEKLYVQDKTLLDVRERYWIQQKQTLKSGLNKC